MKISPLLLAGMATAETILGVAVFSRHGDRTAKHYGNQYLTTLGATQVQAAGSLYRTRYLNESSPYRILSISPNVSVPSQIYASAPDAAVLLGTANYFLQGLYPASEEAATGQTLANGSVVEAPNGVQFVTVHAEGSDEPETVWLKGDEECPALDTAGDVWTESALYAQRVADTKEFFEGLYPGLADVYDYISADQLSYAKAYDIFDLVNVARIHNQSSPAITNITDEQFFQLRTLADSAEFHANYNASNANSAIHAQTLAAAFLTQLNSTVASKGKLKFSLFTGSYNTMLAFAGLTRLTEASGNFYGLPDYAATMGFEVYTEDDSVTEFPEDTEDLQVRFLFRNGTGAALTVFPMFGTGEENLGWDEWVVKMQGVAISSAQKWCNVCESEALFCLAYKEEADAAAGGSGSGSKSKMSNAVAGVVGAMVTLGVFLLAGVVAFVLWRKKGNKRSVVMEKSGGSTKGSVGGSSGSQV